MRLGFDELATVHQSAQVLVNEIPDDGDAEAPGANAARSATALVTRKSRRMLRRRGKAIRPPFWRGNAPVPG
jgi:hypothetical protein